jgi:hypothetical protein
MKSTHVLSAKVGSGLTVRLLQKKQHRQVSLKTQYACCERDNGTYGAARSDTTEDGCNDRLVLTDTSGVAEVTAATIIA